MRVVLIVAMLASGTLICAQRPTAPALADVLSAAAAYVSEYETTPWAVMAEERYQQSATRSGQKQRQRNLRSDVFLANADPGWIWIRDVLDVDGVSLRREPERLLNLLTKAPIDTEARAAQIMMQGAVQHVSDHLRTVDSPTADLAVLRRQNQSHATFSLDGMKSIDGSSYAVVTFKMPLEAPGFPFFAGTVASGKFWIDPASGRVAQSELQFRSVFRTGKATVRYNLEPSVGRWLPIRVDEDYRWSANLPSGGGLVNMEVSELVTGHIEYRKFRAVTPAGRLAPAPAR